MDSLPTMLPPDPALGDTDGYAPNVGGAVIYADGQPSEEDAVKLLQKRNG